MNTQHHYYSRQVVIKPYKIIINIMMVFALLFASASVFASNAKVLQADAFDMTKFVACKLPEENLGRMAYEYKSTDDLQFLLTSKSTMNTGLDRVDGGLNTLLDFTGYNRSKVNQEILGRSLDDTAVDKKSQATAQDANNANKVNMFDRFGVAGLKFTSYAGEWKYLKVDACSDDKNGSIQDPKAGMYYDSRLEPKSTYSDIGRTQDVRTMEFARGWSSNYLKSIVNVVSNWSFTVTKSIVVFVLSLAGLSFKNLAEILGINNMILGSNGDNGVFGYLFINLYIPLSVLIVFIAGIYFAWSMTRKDRRIGFIDIARMAITYVVSIFMCLNPAFFMSLPNNIAIGAQALIAQSLSSSLLKGEGMCATDVGNMKFTDGADKSKGNDAYLENVATNVQSSMGCMFYQTFLLTPWSQGQYGTSWNNLWAKDSVPDWAKKYGETSTVDNSNSSWVGVPTVPMGNKENLKNWAFFQISAQTNAHAPLGKEKEAPKISNGVATDWWRIVDALSNYNEEGKQQEINSSTNSEWKTPAVGAITSPYGNRSISIDPAGKHYGTDIGAPCNAPVYAASSGTVMYAGKEANGGMFIVIKHEKDNVDTAYAHMSFDGVKVKQGDRVKAGQEIAKVSNTGLQGMQCHLHFEVRAPSTGVWYDFDKTVDPEQFAPKVGLKLGVEGSTGQGGNLGISSGDTEQVAIPVYNTPSPYWSYWTGSAGMNRLGVAFSSIFIALIGLAPTGLFALYSAIYALILPLMMLLLPIALLWGLGTQSMFAKLIDYLKSIGYYTVLRIIFGTLMLLSVIFTNIALGYMSSVGWWLGIILLALFSFMLWKFKDVLVNMVSRSRAFSSTFNGDFGSLLDVAKTTSKTITDFGANSLVGGVQAKRYGGSFSRGAFKAGSQQFRNSLYRGASDNGFRKSLRIEAEKVSEMRRGNQGFEISQKNCSSCGSPLGNGIFGRDSRGNYYCQTCFDDGLTPHDAREVLVDIQSARGQATSRTEKIESALNSSKLSVLNSKKGIAQVSTLKNSSDTLTYAEKQKTLDGIVKMSMVDIANGKARKLIADDNAGTSIERHANINAHVPNELRGYLDMQNIERAFREGNWDYLEMAFAIGWRNWYEKEIGEQSPTDVKELVDIARQEIQRLDKHLIQRKDNILSKA